MARPDSWFRFYNTAVDNPKVQRLPDALFKAWVNVLCLASRHGGTLPAPADIAFALRVREGVALGWIKALEDRRLVERNATGALMPHDWNELQYKSDLSTERVKRFRARGQESGKASGETVSETAPEQSREQTQTPEQNREESDSARAHDFEKFWEAYPEKIGRKAACAAWDAAKDRPALTAVLEAVAAYARAKPKDRAWCSPARWITEGRWHDAPARAAEVETPGGPLLRTAKQWRWGAKLYAEKKFWPPSFGPEPGVPGCECPKAILKEFQL